MKYTRQHAEITKQYYDFPFFSRGRNIILCDFFLMLCAYFGLRALFLKDADLVHMERWQTNDTDDNSKYKRYKQLKHGSHSFRLGSDEIGMNNA